MLELYGVLTAKFIKLEEIMNISPVCYSVGALLYCPANNEKIADSIINGVFGNKYSLALCLEDTIGDNFVAEAENILINSIKRIHEKHLNNNFFVPKIFIRIRSAHQINSLVSRFGESSNIIKGFIFPKFSVTNADTYIDTIMETNVRHNTNMYMMPIFENSDIINPHTRYELLYQLKNKLDAVKDNVLNIRVGGNDLCHVFGFRRHVNESIHRIKPISNIFSDILTIYGNEYVVSGPVWEYYDGKGWDEGLKDELADDRLCGFIGKTVIHPKQIDIVNNAYKIPESDVNDAKSILNWNENSDSFVSGNVSKTRMNEYKTHSNWALKTLILAEYYGTI